MITVIAVYIDDILITGNNKDDIDEVKLFLNLEFCIKDQGRLRYSLGMEILHKPEVIVVTQCKFSIDLLFEFDSIEEGFVSAPRNPTLNLFFEYGEPLTDLTIYTRL